MQIEVEERAYRDLGATVPRGHVGAVSKEMIADSKAQMDILDWATFKSLKGEPEDLLPVACRINGAARGSRMDYR